MTDNFIKLRKANLTEAADALSRAKETFEIFLAGPFININEPPDHEDNSTTDSKVLRYTIYTYLNSRGHNIYLGEDHALRTIGEKHYGPLSNAVVYERHYITKQIDIVILLLSSPGSFCEAGDWTSTQDICKIMLMIIDEKFKGQPSYINDGIAKFAKNNGASVEYIPFGDIPRIIGLCDSFINTVGEHYRIEELYGRR